MSSQNPNPPRPRRRIAGERKGARPVAVTETETVETPAEQTEAVDLTKSGPSSPPPPAPVGTSEPSEAAAPSPEPRAVPWPFLAGLAALAAVLLVLAVGPFVDGMGWQDYKTASDQSEVDNARRTAPAVAERAAAAILAYDYKSLESDRNAAASYMTPEYRKQYLDTFDGLVLKLAVKQKAHVETSVRASGVSAAGPDRVEVLLFVNQTTTSTANGGEPQTALNRVVFSMVRQGESWRVDDIKSL